MKRLSRQLALALLLVTLGANSFAQFGGGGRRGRGAGATSNSASSESAVQGPQVRSRELNDKLNELRLRLAITPAQSDLWQKFYAGAFELLDDRDTPRPAEFLTGSMALHQVKDRLSAAQRRATLLANINDAVVRLYAALTPDQQHIADESLAAVVP